MARYTDETRITFNGNRALASKYITEGRKYLGMVVDANNVETAVRQLTNADGVTFRVGYYGSLPFIEITAGAPTSDKYQITTVQGYALAASNVTTNGVLNSWLYLPEGAYSLTDAKAGNDNGWTSYFFDPPDTLAANTQPSATYGAAPSYKHFSPFLKNALDTLPEFPNSVIDYSTYWKNNAENIFAYCSFPWSGAALTNNNTKVFFNAKVLLTVDGAGKLYSAYTTHVSSAYYVYIAGCAVKRTPKGLQAYVMVYVVASYGATPRIELLRIDAYPTTDEKKRLDKCKNGSGYDDKLYGFASEYDAQYDTITRLYSYQVLGYLASYAVSMPIAINGSVNEARTILFKGNAASNTGTTSSEELVIDWRDVDNIIATVVPLSAYAQTTFTANDYSADVYTVSYKKVAAGVALLPAAAYPLGFSTYTHEDASFGGTYTAVTDRIDPYGFNANIHECGAAKTRTQKTCSSGNKLGGENLEYKAIVDFINDIPVYGYIRPEIDVKTTISTQDDLTATMTGEASRTVNIIELLDGFGVPYKAYGSGGSSSTLHVLSVDSGFTVNETRSRRESVGWRFPKYDENGEETLLNWFLKDPIMYLSGVQNSVQAYEYVSNSSVGPIPTVTISRSSSSDSNINSKNELYVCSVDLKTQSCVYGVRTENYVYNGASSGVRTGLTSSIPTTPGLPVTGGVSTTTVYEVGAYAYGALIATHTYTAPVVYSADTVQPFYEYDSVITNQYHYNSGFNTYVPSEAMYNFLLFSENISSPVAFAAYPYTHGIMSLKHPDVVSGLTTLDIDSTDYISTIFASSNRIGIAAYKNTYACSLSLKKTGGFDGFSYASNSTAAAYNTLDYFTGAHGALYYSSPFLISAIAVKKIKL